MFLYQLSFSELLEDYDLVLSDRVYDDFILSPHQLNSCF